MGNAANTLHTLAAERPVAFEQPLTWHTTKKSSIHGKTLHMDKTCRGLDGRIPDSTQQLTMVLDTALTTMRVCGLCVHGDFLCTHAQKDTWRVGMKLAALEHSIDMGATNIMWDPTEQFPTLKKWHELHYQQDMLALLKAVDPDEHLPIWRKRLIDKTQAHVIEPVDQKLLDAETLRWTAIQVLRNGVKAPVASGGTKLDSPEATTIFGWPNYSEFAWSTPRTHPIVLLLKIWTTLLRNGNSAEAATAMTLADETVISEITKAAFDPIYKQGTRKVADAVKRVLTAWESHFNALIAEAKPKMFVYASTGEEESEENFGYLTGDWGSPSIIIRQSLDSVTVGGNTAIVCHPTVVEYLCDLFADVTTIAYIEPIQLTEWPRREEIVGALTLWELDRENSPYHQLEDALTAAKLL